MGDEAVSILRPFYVSSGSTLLLCHAFDYQDSSTKYSVLIIADGFLGNIHTSPVSAFCPASLILCIQASVLSMNLLLLYKTARVPYHGITSSSGDNVPTLDRRAFLHLAVFEAQAAPNETFGVR